MCCKNLIITNKILDELPKSIVIITICTFEVTKKNTIISNKISIVQMEKILKKFNTKHYYFIKLLN